MLEWKRNIFDFKFSLVIQVIKVSDPIKEGFTKRISFHPVPVLFFDFIPIVLMQLLKAFRSLHLN